MSGRSGDFTTNKNMLPCTTVGIGFAEAPVPKEFEFERRADLGGRPLR